MNFVKLRWLLLVPLFFMLPGCGLMTSVNALLPPTTPKVSTGGHFYFRIDANAWAQDGTDYVYFGIEIYYRIFTEAQPSNSGFLSLTSSSQLDSYGFKRLYKNGDLSTDSPTKPVIYFADPYTYKTDGYGYIDFDCYFNNNILTITYYDDAAIPNALQAFELKRAISFPQGHPIDEDYHYKGFDEFEFIEPDKKDGDINEKIWNEHINADPPTIVTLMLYAFSYGYSLDPNHMWAQIESPLEYIGQLDVMCKKYE